MKTHLMHLLLADDDEDDRELFEEALNLIPLVTQLTAVENGIELMAQLNEKHENLPDVLFLDLNMPIKTGLQCLEEIRKNPYWQDLPIVILSTAFDPAEIHRIYKLGAQYYIQKPASFKELVRMIAKILFLPIEKLRTQPSPEEFILTPL